MREFAFTVHSDGLPWDVYYFAKDGIDGTLAFCKRPDGKWIIGIFCAGRLTAEQAKAKLDAGRGRDEHEIPNPMDKEW